MYKDRLLELTKRNHWVFVATSFANLHNDFDKLHEEYGYLFEVLMLQHRTSIRYAEEASYDLDSVVDYRKIQQKGKALQGFLKQMHEELESLSDELYSKHWSEERAKVIREALEGGTH